MTSVKHRRLIDRAIGWLEMKGFTDIEPEVSILKEGGGSALISKCYYKIDVVGRKDGKKIAIECGGSRIEKLIDISGYFNEVYILPYGGEPFLWEEGLNVCQNCGHII